MRGHLVKRSKTSWTIVLDLGRDSATGKRKQRWLTVKGTRRQAEAKLAEALHQIETGTLVTPGKLTTGAFLRQWYESYAKANVRPTTGMRYLSVIEKHLIPALGRIPLTQLRPSHVQALYGELREGGRQDGRPGGLASKTIVHIHRVLREALSHGLKWGLLHRNVADAVDPPRAAWFQPTILDAEGLNRVLEAAKASPYYYAYHLAAFTGCRRSELLGLRWRDVDLVMATISIIQVLHRLRGGQTIISEPKTAKGRRLIPLSPAAVLALREHREKAEAERFTFGSPLQPDDLVFSKPDGTPLDPNTLTREFPAIARRAGYPGVRLHDLRHSHASLMLRQGVHPKVVQERLGHATINITLDVYSHVLPGLQEKAALAFEQAMVSSQQRSVSNPLAT